MPLRFIYDAAPSRVVFRVGALDDLGAETARLGSRALVITTPGQKALGQHCAGLLGSSAIAVYDKAMMHTPGDSVRAGVKHATQLDADCLIAIGGGSTIGLAKAIAFEKRLPILAVATTYSGSEVTPIWGYTENGIKHVARDAHTQPRTVIYDPLLDSGNCRPPFPERAASMRSRTVSKGSTAENANPLVSNMAEEGIRALGAQPAHHREGPDATSTHARCAVRCVAGGCVLAAVGMALHHKLCHCRRWSVQHAACGDAYRRFFRTPQRTTPPRHRRPWRASHGHLMRATPRRRCST